LQVAALAFSLQQYINSNRFILHKLTGALHEALLSGSSTTLTFLTSHTSKQAGKQANKRVSNIQANKH